MPMRIATPDLVTNSYFPALAAEELGLYREEGLEAHVPSIVERDLPFYDPVVREAAGATMNGFAQAIGLLAAPVAYDEVVATRFRDLWSATGP